MTTSQKYASLPDIDLSGHDVYETSEAVGERRGGGGSRRSPTRRRKGGAGGGYISEETSEEEDEDEDEDVAAEGGTKRNGKGGGGKEKFVAGEDEVERLGIDARKARERFAGATNSQALQSAPARARRRKAGLPKGAFYPPLDTSTYELGLTYPSVGSNHGAAPSSSVEDPIARLRRLRFEAEEVERELEARGELNAEPKEGGATAPGETEAGEEGAVAAAKEVPTPKAILSHVRLLRADLARLEKRTGAAAGPGVAEVSGAAKVDELGLARARLIGQIGKSVEPGKEEGPQAQAATTASAATTRTEGLGRIDARLKELEDLVGVGEIEVLDENQRIPRPLLPSLSRIEHLLSLITHPRHLDGISRRVKVLVTELDRAHEARRRLGELGPSSTTTTTTGGAAGEAKAAVEMDGAEGGGGEVSGKKASGGGVMSPETIARLDEALPLLSRIEPLLPLAPLLLSRLRSLSNLHSSASSFASDLSSLRQLLESLGQGQGELEGLLKEVEGSIKENEERSRNNALEVERRIKDVVERMRRLEE